jgi:D-serine dehydratase
MAVSMIAGRPLEEWMQEHPLLEDMLSRQEVFWVNPLYGSFESARRRTFLGEAQIRDAEERLERFAPFVLRAFPETQKRGGLIESPLIAVPALQQRLIREPGGGMEGALLLKCDSDLAVSGSIKARGGIYEVLKHAEDLAVAHALITEKDDYALFDSDRFRAFFSHYSIAVGSTGNLGLSIGIMGARLGFRVVVHMSADAKQWKKDLLRQKGVTVIEYESDYSRAVEEGRKQADGDPKMHFVDDENSTDLFLGYAVAASRLRVQLAELNIAVDREHPLFVYLPCGVGGGPGGITFGLKQVFKDNVHCFFAEPVASPCMLLGLMTQLHNRISVQDFGLNNVTDADGLAVGRASGLVGRTLERVISGVFTVRDEALFKMLAITLDVEKIFLEPSALAGMPGPCRLCSALPGKRYLEKHGLQRFMPHATHIVWATGGSMVPQDVRESYYGKGVTLM